MKCAGLLFGALDNDSRPKRAFSVFAQHFDFRAIVFTSNIPKPYAITAPNFGIRTRLNGVKWIFFALKELFKWRPDVVLAEGLATLIPAAIYASFTNATLIYDGRELYLKDQNGHSTYQWPHRLIERLFIHRADFVFAANDERARLVHQYYRLKRPVIEIHNVPPLKVAPMASLPSEFNYLGPKNGRFLVYQGRLSSLKGRGLDLIVKALPFCSSDIQLIAIGDGAGMDELRTEAINLNLASRIKTHKMLDHDSLYTVLRHCNMGLICYELNGPNNEFCAPNKLYEYAQCSLPMLTTPQATFLKVFANYPIGDTFSRENWLNATPSAIAREIEQALTKSHALAEFERFNKDFNWQMQENKLLTLIGEIKA